MVGIAVLFVVIVGPLLLGLTGWIRARGARQDALPDSVMQWSWRLTIASALLYVLAFNLTFFIQELFLVLPKAFTPGLRPTLFHNNHTWEGEHPLASLFQGTGALAIFLTGIACFLLLRRSRSTTMRLFLIWMAYNGFFQSLPQVVVGSFEPRNDVGMAMNYLGLSATAKTAAALVALAAIPPLALSLTRAMLSLASDRAHIASARARTRFIFNIATLPAAQRHPSDHPVPNPARTHRGPRSTGGGDRARNRMDADGRLARRCSAGERRFARAVDRPSAHRRPGPSLHISGSAEAGRCFLLIASAEHEVALPCNPMR